jgi:beta-ribofuranosylaminobenzene 5'-phosphate synthase
MQTELITPACLLLGLAPLDGQLGQLGITLQFPQIQLLARNSSALAVSGARADLARQQAEHFFRHHHLPPQAEIEIELAIPQFMGLGSTAMLGLSIARALATLHAQPADDGAGLARSVGLVPDEALETHAFAQGGLLLVGEQGALLRRHAIAHSDEADDWVFVFVLPRPPAETPASLARDQRSALRAASRHLSAETANIITADLWPAVERDDIAAFAQALTRIQELNHATLARAGQPASLTPQEQAILDIMRDAGALTAGQTLAGLGLYGLIKGGGPSRELRRALTERLGYFGGTVMASICDNTGARSPIAHS